VEKQRAFYNTGATRPLSFRKEQLRKMYYMLKDNEDEWCQSLNADLGKSRQEAIMAELQITLTDIVNVIKNVFFTVNSSDS
jgi:aldehyde dehydrogenase (NAD+)